MDPIGFGLENGDVFGHYRTMGDIATIDAAGTPPGGSAFKLRGDLFQNGAAVAPL
jgi:hypothetical protein